MFCFSIFSSGGNFVQPSGTFLTILIKGYKRSTSVKLLWNQATGRGASSNLNDFNYRNKALSAKLLRQGYRYFKLRKAFSKFYRKHFALLEKYSVSLKTLLQQGISEPEFYGDLVYRFRNIVGKSNFSEQFRKLINRYKRIGYSLDIMRQTSCLVVNPIIVDGYASLFNCTTAVRASDSMTVSS